jgi:purine-binding chemotaxis protein CheW
MQAVTRIPGTPPSVEGVINLRGTVIPIVDLRKRFQLKKINQDKNTRIVVVSCQGRNVGVVVDAVAEVLRIPVDSIEPASTIFKGEHLDYLLGIIKLSGRLIILLDLDQVLSQKDITALNSLPGMYSVEDKVAEGQTESAAALA